MNIKRLLSAITAVLLIGSSQGQVKISPDTPILLIGLDGFAAKTLKENTKEFPNMEKLIKSGSYTYESRTVLPSSSAVNWHSMFTGSPPELHGITQATSTKPEVEPRIIGEFGKYPGIFGLMRQQRKNDKTGCFYQWKGMQYVLEEEAISKSGHAAGRELTDKSIEFIKKEKPSLMFAIYDEPDHAGHTKGWGSPEYMEECKKLDSYIGELVKCTTETFKGKNPIIFIVSDHGGINKGHGGKTMDEMNHVLIICGKGIKQGYEMKNSIMIYDIGATLAYLKGLQVPQSWVGRPIMEAFSK